VSAIRPKRTFPRSDEMCIGTSRYFVAVRDLVAIGALKTWASGPRGRFTSSRSSLPARLLRTRPARRTRDRLLIIAPHHPARRAVRACTPCAICPSRQHAACGCACRVGQITGTFSAILRPCRGALRDRHERWLWDAMDARAARDECCSCGRRSRVVLALQCRRQAREDASRVSRATVATKQWSPGRARRTPLKPSRREGRVVRLVPVVTPPAFCLQADHGCGQHPAFPAPSRSSRAMPLTARTRNAPRECGRMRLCATRLFDR
jgi:hypothetical protein